jgi:hypothetical protein
MASPLPRRIAATALALAVPLVLCSCSSLTLAFGSTAGGAYSAIEGFRTDETLSAPSWVPTDASGIRYTTDLIDGATILTFASPTHFTPGTCDLMTGTTASTAAAAAVPLDDSWWPESMPSSLFACDGGWTAFTEGDTIYAFTPGSAHESARAA